MDSLRRHVPARKEARIESAPEAAIFATLQAMAELYRADRVNAIRGQHFIKALHGHIARELEGLLHPKAAQAGVRVVEEAKILGSHKSKDVDVAVVHPTAGPLVLVGVRSQMSSIGQNVLNYYQDIVGEAVSLQERYPMTVHSYAYLHPLRWRKIPKTPDRPIEKYPLIDTDFERYAKMYRAIARRDDVMFKQITGAYDEFAYMLVDFEASPLELRDDLVRAGAPDLDMSITTFVRRIAATYSRRNSWFDLFRTDDALF